MDKLLLGIGIVVVIIVGIFAYRYFKNQKNGKEEAEQFLKELEEKMYLIIIECINSIDFHNFKNFEEYEKQVLAIVYQGCWDFVNQKISEAENKDLISVIAKKFLTQEFVEEFIDKILVDREVNDTLANVYGADAIQSMNDSTEDEELSEKFSDNSQYFVEESNPEDLPPVEELEHTKEEIEALNPPTDEGDDLEEGVEEVKDRIIKITNKAGKVMYYLEDGMTGKRKQVSKQYAIESDLEIVDRYNK
ncbi:MAG: hypothetical protein IKR19_08885 [Acholeplasmatales bacterium]|nr:hypothetical protein [Acholeplasmatales bacterium]